MKNIFVLIPLLLVLFSSCEEEGPLIILEESQVALVDTSFISPTPIPSVNKNVYIEEFSGVRCSNCPVGAAEVKSIVDANPGRIVPVTVHSDFLASPYDGNPDLRTPEANLIASNLGPVGSKPSAFINRKIFNNERLVNVIGSWSSLADDILLEATPVNVILSIISFDEVERVFRYEVKLEYSENASNHNLGFFITESEIIAEQLDGFTRIPDYKHEFVLRKSITTIIGEPISLNLEEDLVIIRQFEINLNNEEFDPGQEWDMNHLEIVAFIRESNDEIANAARVKVIE